MLTALDETLRHQIARPFGEVATSDHRFFDRYWFGAYDPEGRCAVICGMGSYANMNVLDGYAAVQRDGRQHNLRASRSLRPAFGNDIGPLHIEVVEPFERINLRLEGGPHRTAFELTWRAISNARLEPHQFGRLDGRRWQDYLRYDQIGSVDGWVDVDGQRMDAASWFGGRDHSWGVRRGVGGFEPFTGSPGPETDRANRIFLYLSSEDVAVLMFLKDEPAGRVYLEGTIYRRPDRVEVEIVEVEHDVTMRAGGATLEHARLVLHDAEGGEWHIEATPLTSAWVYRGTGYDRGWNDGLGLGVWRGDLVVEHDVYGVDDPENVVWPDSTTSSSVHREAPMRFVINGSPGVGHMPVFTQGSVSYVAARDE